MSSAFVRMALMRVIRTSTTRNFRKYVVVIIVASTLYLVFFVAPPGVAPSGLQRHRLNADDVMASLSHHGCRIAAAAADYAFVLCAVFILIVPGLCTDYEALFCF